MISIEIKTSQEISKEYNVTTDGMTANKRWVAVENDLVIGMQEMKKLRKIIQLKRYLDFPVENIIRVKGGIDNTYKGILEIVKGDKNV